jgi:hypothetical protein
MLRVGGGQTNALDTSHGVDGYRMKTHKTPFALSLAAIAAILAVPAAAAEEAVVPPSNSAAAQYTEAFPTSGGDKKTDQAAHHRSPIKVLGANKTKQLEKQGPAGRATAEAAAATAPVSVASTPPADTTPPNGGGGHHASGDGQGTATPDRGGQDAQQEPSTAPQGADAGQASAAEPAGSSGLASTIGQATGLSSAAGSGPLLPLVILATVLWSLAYLWRQRRQVG